MQIEKNCPICGSDRLSERKAYQFAENHTGGKRPRVDMLIDIYLKELQPEPSDRATVHMTQCESCSFLFTNPRLTTADLDKKYATIAQHDLERRKVRGRAPHVDRRRERVTPLITSWLPEGKEEAPKILDYGGAEGFLLTPFIDAGAEGYVLDYINYPKEDDRITYLGQGLSEAARTAGPFDAIFVLHTLEHVADPVGMLRSLSELLTDEGVLYAEVPLGSWLEWRDLREPLTHINFFSEASFAAASREAGLRLEHINTDWQYVTHQEKTLCINAIMRRGDGASVSPLQSQEQMHPLKYLPGGLSANPRYYGKVAIKSLLGVQ